MNPKSTKSILIKKNLKLILDTMMPGDEYMPCFSKAVKIRSIIQKLEGNKFFYTLQKKI